MARKKSSRSIKLTVAAPKPRNRVVQNPLLRKGGVHERAKSATRFDSKQQVRKAAREWQGSRDAHSRVFPSSLCA